MDGPYALSSDAEEKLAEYMVLRAKGFVLLNEKIKRVVQRLRPEQLETFRPSLMAMAVAQTEEPIAVAPLLEKSTNEVALTAHVVDTLVEGDRLIPRPNLNAFSTVPGGDMTLDECEKSRMLGGEPVSGRTIDILVHSFRMLGSSDLGVYVFPAGTDIRKDCFEQLYCQATKGGVCRTVVFPLFLAAPIPHWYTAVLADGSVTFYNSAPDCRDPAQEQTVREFATFFAERSTCHLCSAKQAAFDAWHCPTCKKRVCGMCRFNILVGRETNKNLVQQKRLAVGGQNPIVDDMKCSFCQAQPLPVLPNLQAYRDRREPLELIDILGAEKSYNRWRRQARRIAADDVTIVQDPQRGRLLRATRFLPKGAFLNYPVMQVPASHPNVDLYGITTRDGIVVAPPDTPSAPAHFVNEPMEDCVFHVLRLGFQLRLDSQCMTADDVQQMHTRLHEHWPVFEAMFAQPDTIPVATFGEMCGVLQISIKQQQCLIRIGYRGNTKGKVTQLTTCFDGHTDTFTCELPKDVSANIAKAKVISVVVTMADTPLLALPGALPFRSLKAMQAALQKRAVECRVALPKASPRMLTDLRAVFRRQGLPNAMYVESFVSRKRKRHRRTVLPEIDIVLWRDVWPGEEITVNYGWGNFHERRDIEGRNYFPSTACYFDNFPPPRLMDRLFAKHVLDA